MKQHQKVKRKYPTSAVIAATAIILLEIAFFIKTEPLTGLPYLTPTADDAVVTAKLALFQDVEGKIAIVGDSSSMYGLVPSILDENGADEYLNIGTLASLTVLGYSELAIQIMKGSFKPKAILLSVLPQTLEIDHAKARSMGQLGRFLAAYGATDSSIYSVSHQEVLQWFARKHQFNVFPPEFGGSYDVFLNTLTSSNGFYEEHVSKISRYRIHDSLRPSELSTRSIDLLVRTANEHSIPLLFLLNPKPESIVTDSYINEVNKFRSEIQTRYPSLITIDHEFITLNDRLFGTETHLNANGASEYSKMLAPLIESALSEVLF